MASYNTTWDKTNLLCKENLERVENESAKMCPARPEHARLVDRANGIHLSYLDEGRHKDIRSATNAKYGDGITNAHFKVTNNAFEANSSLAYFFSLELSDNPSIDIILQRNGNEYANLGIDSNNELTYNDSGGSSVSSGTVVSQGEYQLTLRRTDNGDGTGDTKVKLFNTDGTLHSSIDITNRSLPSGSGGEVILGDSTITDVTFYESRIWVDSIPIQPDLDTMADPTAVGSTNFENTMEGQETTAWFHEPATVQNNSWGDRNGSSKATGNGATREFGNIIENQDNIRIVTICPQLGSDSVGDGAVKVSVGTDLSSSVDYVPARVREYVSDNVYTEKRHPLSFLVKPGEEYRVENISSSSASLESGDGATWYEFDFDAAYSPQTWTHDEVLDPSKLRTYAHHAFGVGDTTTGSDGRRFNNIEDEIVVEGMNLVTHNLEIESDTTTDNEATIKQRDKGGTLSKIASAFIGSEGSSMVTSAFFAVNPSGAYAYDNPNQKFADAYSIENRPPTLPIVSFRDGDAGAFVGTNFTDLDNNAAKGLNIEQDPTRNEDVNGNDESKSTPSTDSWSIVSCIVFLETDESNLSVVSAEIKLWDTTDTEQWDLAPKEEYVPSDTLNETRRTMMTVVPPGWSWSIDTTDNVTVEKRTEWVL